MIYVNVALERRRPRKPGQRQRWEMKRLPAVAFAGDWQDNEAHTAFRRKVYRDNPGWRIMGYAPVAGGSQVANGH